MLRAVEDAQLESRIATVEEGLALVSEGVRPAAASNDRMSTEWDVIVVGAGMAGLTAARALAQAGLRVLVLEASVRTGGRIHTVRAGGHVVELGAEFIHGRPPALWSLIEEAGLETYERVGESWHLQDGNLEPDDDSRRPISRSTSWSSLPGLDCSFVEYINQRNLAQGEQTTMDRLCRRVQRRRRKRNASALALGIQQKAEDAIEGDRLWKLAGGYDQLTSYLERKLRRVRRRHHPASTPR